MGELFGATDVFCVCSRDTELPFLFCSALLREQDGVSTVETIQPPPERRPAAEVAAASANDNEAEEEWSALVGQLVRNPRRIEDLDGVQQSVFVFEDVSVRTQGTYRLEFMLGEASVVPDQWKVASERETDNTCISSDDDLIPPDSRQSCPIPLMWSLGRTTPACLVLVRQLLLALARTVLTSIDLCRDRPRVFDASARARDPDLDAASAHYARRRSRTRHWWDGRYHAVKPLVMRDSAFPRACGSSAAPSRRSQPVIRSFAQTATLRPFSSAYMPTFARCGSLLIRSTFLYDILLPRQASRYPPSQLCTLTTSQLPIATPPSLSEEKMIFREL